MIDRKDILSLLTASMKKEQKNADEGWTAGVDQLDRSINDLLSDINDHLVKMYKQHDQGATIEDMDLEENIHQMWHLVSMIRIKLGLPARLVGVGLYITD